MQILFNGKVFEMKNGLMSIVLKVPNDDPRLKKIHRGQVRDIELKTDGLLKIWTVRVISRYVINGTEDYTLKLIKGKTYLFDIDAIGHPFYFTTNSVGGQGNKDSLMGLDEIVTDKGIISFTVRENLPNKFYYQCQKHPNMGSNVIIKSNDHLKHMIYTILL